MDILIEILPYSLGLIISPLPVIALILLLVSNRGILKGTVFIIFWLIASYFSILAVSQLVSLAGQEQVDGVKPTWQYGLAIFMGTILLIVALLTRTRVYRKKHDEKVRTPGWLKIIDKLNVAEIAILSVALVVVNPVNLSMVLITGITLANFDTTLQQSLVPVAIFVSIGSLSVLLPYFSVLVAGEKSHSTLHAVRQWLSLYGDRLSFWAAFGFGVVFLFDGIQGLAK